MGRRRRFEFGDEELFEDPFGVAGAAAEVACDAPTGAPGDAELAAEDRLERDRVVYPAAELGYERELDYEETLESQSGAESEAEQPPGARAGVRGQGRLGVGAPATHRHLASRGVVFTAAALVVVVVGAVALTSRAPQGSSPREVAKRPPAVVDRVTPAKLRPRQPAKAKRTRPRRYPPQRSRPAPQRGAGGARPAPVGPVLSAPLPGPSPAAGRRAPSPSPRSPGVSAAQAEFGFGR